MNSRVIPCLLLRRGGLVKSKRFKDHRYIGDPINAVRIFNEKEVDELVFLDIDAGPAKRPPDFELLCDIASEAFMPMAYGGGLTDLDEVKRIYGLGFEKVVFNTAAHESPKLFAAASNLAGSSSVVGAMDVRRSIFGRYSVVTRCGARDSELEPAAFARRLVELGAGEIIVNSINRDGTMEGYDLELIRMVAAEVKVPVVAMGGAGRVSDFTAALSAGASAVAAGSMFVYHGKHRGVLISYPSAEQLGRAL